MAPNTVVPEVLFIKLCSYQYIYTGREGEREGTWRDVRRMVGLIGGVEEGGRRRNLSVDVV